MRHFLLLDFNQNFSYIVLSMPNKKTLILQRMPPGDNWKHVDGEETFTTLTSALSFAYKQSKLKEFHVSAAEGKVWVISDSIEREPEIDSLYGD